MKLNIPPLGQRDPRWKDKKLGGGGSTGNYGCYLTGLSMYLIYCGHEDMLPDTLNEVFKQKGVYDGNNINTWAVGNIFGDFKVIERYECEDIPCDLSKIDNQLNKRQPIIAKVDFDLNPSTKGDWHYVIIIGKTDDGHYITNDPWVGETYFFDAKYGDPVKNIYGLRIFEGTPKETINYQDEINKLYEQLKVSNESLSAKSQELAITLEGLQKYQDKANSFEELYNKTLLERDEAVSLQRKDAYKITDLQKQVDSLTKENDTLKEELSAAKAGNLTTLSLWRFLKIKLTGGW